MPCAKAKLISSGNVQNCRDRFACDRRGQQFFDSIGDSIDAEDKRQKFKNAYKKIFKSVIEENNITHILQGTLATDLIESGHLGNAMTIKSHHNVGLDFGVVEVTPLLICSSMKVRALARSIGLEASISERKPFPGPGLLAIRN